MDYKRRINQIIERARRLRMPIKDVAAAGGVSKSTFYRWEQPDANPRMRTMMTALDAMETHLNERERALVEDLTHGRLQ
jgi:DNA-binding phage protein